MHRGTQPVAQVTELHRAARCELLFDHEVPREHQPFPLLRVILTVFIFQSRVPVGSVIFIDPKWTSQPISFCPTRKLSPRLIQPTVACAIPVPRRGCPANPSFSRSDFNYCVPSFSEVLWNFNGQQRYPWAVCASCGEAESPSVATDRACIPRGGVIRRGRFIRRGGVTRRGWCSRRDDRLRRSCRRGMG